jgi:TPR repeat protein
MKIAKFLFLLGLLIAAAACHNNPIQTVGSVTRGTIEGALTSAERRENEDRAREGDVQSMYRLGRSSCCGVGGILSTRTALKWFFKAARKGHAESQLEISKIYAGNYGLKTIGLRADFTLAYMWFEQSQTSGRVFAEYFRRRLMRRVGAEQIKEAREMKKDWKNARCEIEG